MNIFVIHRGSHSYQSWGPVFSSRELAQAYIDKNYKGREEDYDGPCIEEFELDKPNAARKEWSVDFDGEGNVTRADFSEQQPPWAVEGEAGEPFSRRYPGWQPGMIVVTNFYADNEQAAIKIASEYRTRYRVQKAREPGVRETQDI